MSFRTSTANSRLRRCLPAAALIFLVLACRGQISDWPQFRGPSGNGVGVTGQIPLEWSDSTNLAWKIRIPGSGWSQPIIIGRTIYLTSAVSDKVLPLKGYEAGLTDPFTLSGAKATAPDLVVEWRLW